jgi:hypothetical protein
VLFTVKVILNLHSALGRYIASFCDIKTASTRNCHHACTLKCLEIKYDMMKIVSLRIIIEFMRKLDSVVTFQTPCNWRSCG